MKGKNYCRDATMTSYMFSFFVLECVLSTPIVYTHSQIHQINLISPSRHDLLFEAEKSSKDSDLPRWSSFSVV